MKHIEKYFIHPTELKDGNRDFLVELFPKNAICCEIGVWWGNFSERILFNAKPKLLHLIDPYVMLPNDPIRERIGKNQENMNNIYKHVAKRLRRDNVVFHRDFSYNTAHKFKDNYFDWIYIDGDHSYMGVKKDLELYFAKVKRRGLITGDDYDWGNNQPVKKAVDEFIESFPVEKIQIKNGQYIIRKK